MSDEKDFSPSLENSYVVEAEKASDTTYEFVELIAQSLVFVAFVVAFIFRTSNVDGSSMLNTLHHGDHLIIWRYAYTPHDGDVITIRKNGTLDETIVKRVIATEGETFHLDMSSNSVYVNGRKLDESSYIKEPMHEMVYPAGNTNLPEVVPEGCCIVLGDNRNNSSDSRDASIGVIKNENIIGHAVAIHFPFYRIRKLDSIREYAKN